MVIEDRMLALAFCWVIGIGAWKEYLTVNGNTYEVRKYLFPFFIAMRFHKIGEYAAEEKEGNS
jgi:hypothetical protein